MTAILALPITPRPNVAQAYLDAHSASPDTRETYARCIDVLSAMTPKPWHELGSADCQSIKARLQGRMGPCRVNVHLSVLRGLLKQAWRCGLMEGEAMERALDGLANVTFTRLPAGRMVDQGERQSLYQSCDLDRIAGLRDRALLEVAFAAGLRRDELAALDLCDWREGSSELVVRHGKGDKERAVPVESCVPALNAWVAARGQEPGPLFCHVHHGKVEAGLRLSRRAIYKQIRQAEKRAGLAQPITTHDARRTAITRWIERGGLRTAQYMAGHADPRTTAQYDMEAQQRARKVVQGLEG